MTTAALLTPPGTGAIAVIAVCGPHAWTIVRALCSRPLPDEPPPWRFWLTTLCGDEVIVAVESRNRVEIHCHGGQQMVRTILQALHERGCVPEATAAAAAVHAETVGAAHSAADAAAGPAADAAVHATLNQVAVAGAEKTAFLVAEVAVDAAAIRKREAEALEALLPHALTLRAAGVLLDQLQGAFDREVLAFQQDHDMERLRRLARRIRLGQRLTRPWTVAIAGAPNAGKSSLINALAGFERAIVSPVPGTTRDSVSVLTALDGWPVELIDTAGLRPTAEALEAAGIERARQVLHEADLVVWLYDAADPRDGMPSGCVPSGSVPWEAIGTRPMATIGAEGVKESVAAAAPASGVMNVSASSAGTLESSRAALLVANKCDLLHEPPPPGVLSISALTGENVGLLAGAIIRRLIPDPPEAGAAVPVTMRQAAVVRLALAAAEAGKIEQAGKILTNGRLATE